MYVYNKLSNRTNPNNKTNPLVNSIKTFSYFFVLHSLCYSTFIPKMSALFLAPQRLWVTLRWFSSSGVQLRPTTVLTGEWY